MKLRRMAASVAAATLIVGGCNWTTYGNPIQSASHAFTVADSADGWSNSWQEWPHGGTGTWVCTREIPSLG